MEVREKKLWCKSCCAPVGFLDKSTAVGHIASAAHKKAKVLKASTPVTPGSSAPLLSPSQDDSMGLENEAAPQPVFFPRVGMATKQLSLHDIFEGASESDRICQDWVAAFLQAGIPLAKLVHTAIIGVIRKYTEVSGCLKSSSTQSRHVAPVQRIHIAAIRHLVQGCKMWVGTDEWTDSQGHGILGIIVGTKGQSWVVATKTLVCNGPNRGVEHTEVAKEVNSALSMMGIQSEDVFAFVSDSASTLGAAYEHVLKPLYPFAKRVRCLSHTLNNCTAALTSGFEELEEYFRWGPQFLHAKSQAARRRH